MSLNLGARAFVVEVLHTVVASRTPGGSTSGGQPARRGVGPRQRRRTPGGGQGARYSPGGCMSGRCRGKAWHNGTDKYDLKVQGGWLVSDQVQARQIPNAAAPSLHAGAGPSQRVCTLISNHLRPSTRNDAASSSPRWAWGGPHPPSCLHERSLPSCNIIVVPRWTT